VYCFDLPQFVAQASCGVRSGERIECSGAKSSGRSTDAMPTLKFIPPPVASADELMAMAHAMEKEAARRYRELAARMRLRDDPDLARLFEFLASIEEKHAVHVAERAADRLGARIEPTRIAWEVPENFDE